MRKFEEWFLTIKENIVDYKYYVDFDNVFENVNMIKPELNILNSLIGSKNIEKDFIKLIEKHNEILRTIPILLAIRKKQIYCRDSNGEFNYDFDYIENLENDKILYFMEQTGIFNLIRKNIVTNLIDYVYGVEVGLSSNSRKNRTGKIMEEIVENYLVNKGYILNINYFKEIYLKDIIEKFNITKYEKKLLKINKRFDFILVKNGIIYAIECNFYTSSGSKLNEIARSYQNLNLEFKDNTKFKFVWITDGNGWKSSKKELEKAFKNIKNLYNLNDLENNIL